eukprot:superscaffoldBa00007580_g22662
MKRLCASLLQELRRLLDETQQHDVEPQQDSPPPAAQVEGIIQSDVPPGVSSQSEQTPMAGSGRIFSCSVCSRSFSRQTNLSAHLRVHGRLRPFTCQLCGKGFSAQSSVRVHQLTVHSQQRPYSCSYCGKVFGTRSHLRTHQTSNRQRRLPLTCSACGETLAAACCLRGHRLTCQKAHDKFSMNDAAGLRFRRQHRPQVITDELPEHRHKGTGTYSGKVFQVTLLSLGSFLLLPLLVIILILESPIHPEVL